MSREPNFIRIGRKLLIENMYGAQITLLADEEAALRRWLAENPQSYPSPAAPGVIASGEWSEESFRSQLTAATERAERAERQLAEAGKAWHGCKWSADGYPDVQMYPVLDKLPKPEGGESK